ncbi:Os04g0294812 [Oryza sativa Japonica Group]|uniref:Os04g0294812 protein n=1 Tax=Oryza sativa subsp. japonica TaxID=39947 RepID=A0A0P0W867_ORYSJ|nr:Os04g0294812 [Oryza sativa Japonica Group]
MASSLTPSPATSCSMHHERLTNEQVDEMINETDVGKRINYKEFATKFIKKIKQAICLKYTLKNKENIKTIKNTV